MNVLGSPTTESPVSGDHTTVVQYAVGDDVVLHPEADGHTVRFNTEYAD